MSITSHESHCRHALLTFVIAVLINSLSFLLFAVLSSVNRSNYFSASRVRSALYQTFSKIDLNRLQTDETVMQFITISHPIDRSMEACCPLTGWKVSMATDWPIIFFDASGL